MRKKLFLVKMHTVITRFEGIFTMMAHPLIALQNYVKSHDLTLMTLPLSPGMNVVGSPCRRYNFWVSEGHKCLSLCVERVLVLELARVSPLMVKNQGFNVQYHDDHNRLH